MLVGNVIAMMHVNGCLPSNCDPECGQEAVLDSGSQRRLSELFSFSMADMLKLKRSDKRLCKKCVQDKVLAACY